MVNMLLNWGIETKLVQVVDNNDIDREVTAFKPTHVFIEAFWVIPSKFDVLMPLHPDVKWFVRNHSQTDFLAAEGGMIRWGIEYMRKGVFLASNSEQATEAFAKLAESYGANPELSIYLPNYYEPTLKPSPEVRQRWLLRFNRNIPVRDPFPSVLKVGCFGAVRPLKNNLNQAIAAMIAADKIGVPLEFSINSTRMEGGGNAQVKALRALFDGHPTHKLIEVPWVNHDDFLDLVEGQTLVSQVSNSETFNIVAADAAICLTPIVGSEEIPWLPSTSAADEQDVNDIASKMVRAASLRFSPSIAAEQFLALRRYVNLSAAIWISTLRGRRN